LFTLVLASLDESIRFTISINPSNFGLNENEEVTASELMQKVNAVGWEMNDRFVALSPPSPLSNGIKHLNRFL
jgi:hypothetical protein